MTRAWAVGIVVGAWLGSTTPDVRVEASYEAPKAAGGTGAVVVHLAPSSPDIRVDQQPAPRLTLTVPSVLVDRQAPAATGTTVPTLEPDFARYLDPAVPVRFAVAPDPKAPKGSHTVLGTLTFAYCSKSQGWCKRGKQPLELAVTIR